MFSYCNIKETDVNHTTSLSSPSDLVPLTPTIVIDVMHISVLAAAGPPFPKAHNLSIHLKTFLFH